MSHRFLINTTYDNEEEENFLNLPQMPSRWAAGLWLKKKKKKTKQSKKMPDLESETLALPLSV